MSVLLVEDDEVIAEFVAKGLREAGFAVDRAADGEAGLDLALRHSYDAAVVDVMLPRRDGLSLIDQLRRRGRKTPVLILSARRSVDDRVRGLQTGGDDYLVKPFAFSELLARLQALVRRASGVAEPTRLEVGPLGLDLLTREVEREGVRLDLRPREYALLEYLMRNAGRIVDTPRAHVPGDGLRTQARTGPPGRHPLDARRVRAPRRDPCPHGAPRRTRRLWVVPARNHRFRDDRGEPEKRLDEALEWIRRERR